MRGGAQHPDKRRAGGHQVNLQDVACFWATPRSSDGEKGSPNQRGSKGDVMLPAQAAQWPTPMAGSAGTENCNAAGNSDFSRGVMAIVENWVTPTARMHKGGGETLTCKDGKSRLDMLDYQAEQFHPSPLDQVIPAGPPSSPTRRRLNPLFVEWLMGWPTGLSGFDTAAMASCPSPPPLHGCGCMNCWLTTQRAMLADLLAIDASAQAMLL